MIFNCRYVKTQIGHIPPSQYCKYELGLIVIYTNEFAIDKFILKNIWGNTSDGTQGHDLQTLTVTPSLQMCFRLARQGHAPGMLWCLRSAGEPSSPG